MVYFSFSPKCWLFNNVYKVENVDGGEYLGGQKKGQNLVNVLSYLNTYARKNLAGGVQVGNILMYSMTNLHSTFTLRDMEFYDFSS